MTLRAGEVWGEWYYHKPRMTFPNEASAGVSQLAEQETGSLPTLTLCTAAAASICAVTTVLLLSPLLLMPPNFS